MMPLKTAGDRVGDGVAGWGCGIGGGLLGRIGGISNVSSQRWTGRERAVAELDRANPTFRFTDPARSTSCACQVVTEYLFLACPPFAVAPSDFPTLP